MKWKNQSFGKGLWLLYISVLAIVLFIFFFRATSGEYVTEASDGQIIHMSNQYKAGKFYDRKEKDVSEEEMFSELIGLDIASNKNSKMYIAGVTPWVFGLEDNRFDLESLLNPFEERVGGNALLSYELDLMKYIDCAVSGSGYENVSIVVSNWKTGEILATYGNVYEKRYHPGSTIKPILAAAVLTINPELANYTYECKTSTHTFATEDGEFTVACAGGSYHGTMNMESALVKSCNGYFISLVQQVPKDELTKVMEQWGFDSVLSFEQFFYWDHSFFDKSEKSIDYLMAAIGQGNTYVTQFGLNLCTNAIVSGTGSIQEPRRVLAKTSVPSDTQWKDIVIENKYEFCNEDVAASIRDMMLKVTLNGTGRSFHMEGLAAKTGTAQNERSNTIWTTGGLVNEDTPYSITVCVDEVSKKTSSSEAGKIAKEILTYMTGGDWNENKG